MASSLLRAYCPSQRQFTDKSLYPRHIYVKLDQSYHGEMEITKENTALLSAVASNYKSKLFVISIMVTCQWSDDAVLVHCNDKLY